MAARSVYPGGWTPTKEGRLAVELFPLEQVTVQHFMASLPEGAARKIERLYLIADAFRFTINMEVHIKGEFSREPGGDVHKIELVENWETVVPPTRDEMMYKFKEEDMLRMLILLK